MNGNVNDALEHIKNKYNFDFGEKSPFFINEGRGKNGLARLFNELDFKVGAEIGVHQGRYSKVLSKTMPELKLYCIDAWTKYDGYIDVKGKQERYDAIYESAKIRLAPFNCHLIKKWSMDAVKDFEDESLDFVYIDGNHDFEHCTEDIANWSKKVKIGGIISGHDFVRYNYPGLNIHVKEVVCAWTRSYKIRPWFVFDGDDFPSWMWVKPE